MQITILHANNHLVAWVHVLIGPLRRWQLIKLVRGFGKVYYARIQYMFSFFVVTMLVCTLLLGLQLVSGEQLHFATATTRQFIVASSAVVANRMGCASLMACCGPRFYVW